MFTLGKIVLFSAEDLVENLKVSKETAYKILDLPQAKVIQIGRKKLISEDNLSQIMNSKIKI